MGKVYTTSENLTSIANAIRAKSGNNSSLVYPTGFINEIENISGDIWDGYGANPVLLYSHDYNIAIEDTSIASITPSTTNQVIYTIPTLTINDISPTTYDFYFHVTGYINFLYKQELTTPYLSQYNYYISVGRNALSSNSSGSRDFEQSQWRYKSATGNLPAYSQTQGITLWIPNLLTFSNTAATLPEINIRLGLSTNTYFTDTILSQLDLQNTKMIISVKMKQYKAQSTRYNQTDWNTFTSNIPTN